MDYEALMDGRQKHVHEHFSPNSKLNDPEFVKKLLDWITFWRRNPSRFVQRYFGITLYLYQHIILYLMDIFPSICIVAARSAAKSFIIAVYACKEAILRPGSLIVVASATKKQARLIVSEKIAKEILPRSPLLQQEIKTIKDNQNDIEVKFNNGSSIVVLVANENVRGYRATVFIYEEFRMIVKSIIDTVLSPTLFQRQIPFRIKYPDEYKELKEEPKEIYISSAWYKSHWMWDYMKLVTRDMLGKGKSVLIGMDYSIALKHEIKTRDFLVKERKKLDRVAWTIEYENQMVAENAHAYFTYDMLNKNRVLKRPFYPRKNEDVLSKVKAKHTIPKQAGEIRIIACDIAPEGGTGNDNSVFTCIRALPESKEYKVSDTSGDHIEVKQGYRRQVVYMEPQAEFETTKQAIRIKQLFADFEADYCVLDTRNAGVAIYDALAKVLYDVDRNVEYEPWTCMNDDKLKARIVIAGQKEAVFSVKASLELNSKIAVSMRDSLNNRMIELMVSNQEGVEELQRLYPEYVSADVDTQLFYERPFLETVALINEMIGLEYTVQNQTNLIKIEERPGARKDRYTSVSYAKSSLGDVQSAMAIVAKSLAEQKQVFDTIQNQTVFGANDLAFRKHDFESGSSAIGIDQTSPELLYRYTTGMEAAFAIAASIGETEFHYSLGDGSNAIGIETSEPETIAEKKLQIGNAIEMFYELVVETISLFAVSNDAEILMTLNAGMKRYRLLSDLDDKTLAEIDDMTLEELDFVVLA